MKTEMCIDFSVCCSMSSFGLDSLPQDHIMNSVFFFFSLQNVGFLMHFLVLPSHPLAIWNLNVSTALLGFCSCSCCNVLSGNQ